MGQAQRVVEDKLATELFIPTRPRISLAKSASAPAAEQPKPASAPQDRSANREFGSVLRKIRSAADALRASELRVSDLKAGLEALSERATRELAAAGARIKELEGMAAAEAARADAAEQKRQEAEERLAEFVDVLAEEFDGAGIEA
jgi:small-conductance mechanosensitive channel